MNVEKNNKIKNSLLATKARRENQRCVVFTNKLDKSHLSKEKLDKLKILFIQSKQLYNHLLSESENGESIFDINPLINEVNVRNKDKVFEKRKIDIGSQIKQSIWNRMLNSITSLSKLKENGRKVGKLKYKSEVNSIPLKQYGITYKIKKNYLSIQKLKYSFKVNGLKQIPANAEFANAVLTKKNDDFYLKTTVFLPKEEKVFEKESVGIDFGIATTITLSTGEKFNIKVPENKRTQKLRRRLSRKIGGQKGVRKSKSYKKNLSLVNKSVEKTSNIKKDERNKAVSKIVNKYECICVQDENIKGWKDTKFGKEVHNSALGGIMSDLKRKSHTLLTVPRYFQSTQLCEDCFHLNKIPLDVRTYECKFCGDFHPCRDINAAESNEDVAMGRIDIDSIPTEYRDLKIQVEECAATNRKIRKHIPVKPEAHDFSRG